jgi:hypothetical protein
VAGQVPARLAGQVRPALDADHAAGQAGQQGGLEAQAGADLEHVVTAGQVQALDHPGRQRRLRSHLPVPDRDRLVAVGSGEVIAGDESGTGSRADRCQHPLITDAGRPDRRDQVRRGRGPAHDGPDRSASRPSG